MKKQAAKHLSFPVILLISFVTGVLGAAVGTFLVSAHGGDASKIHGCKNSNGVLRVVGENEDCRSNETSLDWNIQGPPGAPGPTGVPGTGGSLDGFNARHHKTGLTPNAFNDIFTFPLAPGEYAGVNVQIGQHFTKASSDWAIWMHQVQQIYYNDGGTLRGLSSKSVIAGDGDFSSGFSFSSGGDFTASLESGIVTWKFKPTQFNPTPDNAEADFIILTPEGQTLTFL